MQQGEEVRAAGGAVIHDGRVLVVHRPKYDDWSLPKGKLDPGEDWAEAALREVQEEAGIDCELGAELPGTRYVDNKGRDKRVRYWLMTVLGDPADGDFVPNDEVDEIRWVDADEARQLLTYDRDREIAAAAFAPR